MTATPDSIEGTIIVVVRWVKLGVEVFGAGLVTLGVCLAIVNLLRTLAARNPAEFTATRLILARHLALALELSSGPTFSARRCRRVGIRSASWAPSR